VNFDSLKNYNKYFPFNNVSFVINETNKIYNMLKKNKNAYLFDKRGMNEEKFAACDKTKNKLKGYLPH